MIAGLLSTADETKTNSTPASAAVSDKGVWPAPVLPSLLVPSVSSVSSVVMWCNCCDVGTLPHTTPQSAAVYIFVTPLHCSTKQYTVHSEPYTAGQ